MMRNDLTLPISTSVFFFRYDTMLQCWKAKPTLRPSFTELVENIGELLEEGVRMVRTMHDNHFFFF